LKFVKNFNPTQPAPLVDRVGLQVLTHFNNSIFTHGWLWTIFDWGWLGRSSNLIKLANSCVISVGIDSGRPSPRTNSVMVDFGRLSTKVNARGASICITQDKFWLSPTRADLWLGLTQWTFSLVLLNQNRLRSTFDQGRCVPIGVDLRSRPTLANLRLRPTRSTFD